VLLGNGDGTFQPARNFAAGRFPANVVVADFNGDGVLDVAAPDGFAETMAVLPGNGDGTLGTATLFGGGLADSAAAVNVAGFQPSVVLATPNRVVVVKNTTASK